MVCGLLQETPRCRTLKTCPLRPWPGTQSEQFNQWGDGMQVVLLLIGHFRKASGCILDFEIKRAFSLTFYCSSVKLCLSDAQSRMFRLATSISWYLASYQRFTCMFSNGNGSYVNMKHIQYMNYIIQWILSYIYIIMWIWEWYCYFANMRSILILWEHENDIIIMQMWSDISKVVEVLYGDAPPPILMIGHSMGGAIAVHAAAANHIPSLLGLCVIDVVEGTGGWGT